MVHCESTNCNPPHKHTVHSADPLLPVPPDVRCRCGGTDFVPSWRQNPNGPRHVRVDCCRCGNLVCCLWQPVKNGDVYQRTPIDIDFAVGKECLAAALAYLEHQRWSVIQLCPASHRGCGGWHTKKCLQPGKVPYGAWKPRQATLPTGDELVEAWRRQPYANVGVVLGKVSGIIRVDADGACGLREFERLCQGQIPRTVAFSSGTGAGYLFAIPPDVKVKTTPLNSSVMTGEHQELRFQGEGAQTVLPPSLHIRGTRYTWIEGCSPDEIAPAPMTDGMIDIMRVKPVMVSVPPMPASLDASSTAEARSCQAKSIAVCNRNGDDEPDRLHERISAWLAKAEPAISGRGGRKQTVSVGSNLVVDWDLPFDQAVGYFRQWNQTCQPPWDDNELHDIMQWVLNNERPGRRGRLRYAERPPTYRFDQEINFTLDRINNWSPERRVETTKAVLSAVLGDDEADAHTIAAYAAMLSHAPAANELDQTAVADDAAALAEAAAGADSDSCDVEPEPKIAGFTAADFHPPPDPTGTDPSIKCLCSRQSPGIVQEEIDGLDARVVYPPCKTWQCPECGKVQKQRHIDTVRRRLTDHERDGGEVYRCEMSPGPGKKATEERWASVSSNFAARWKNAPIPAGARRVTRADGKPCIEIEEPSLYSPTGTVKRLYGLTRMTHFDSQTRRKSSREKLVEKYGEVAVYEAELPRNIKSSLPSRDATAGKARPIVTQNYHAQLIHAGTDYFAFDNGELGYVIYLSTPPPPDAKYIRNVKKVSAAQAIDGLCSMIESKGTPDVGERMLLNSHGWKLLSDERNDVKKWRTLGKVEGNAESILRRENVDAEEKVNSRRYFSFVALKWQNDSEEDRRRITDLLLSGGISDEQIQSLFRSPGRAVLDAVGDAMGAATTDPGGNERKSKWDLDMGSLS